MYLCVHVPPYVCPFYMYVSSICIFQLYFPLAAFFILYYAYYFRAYENITRNYIIVKLLLRYQTSLQIWFYNQLKNPLNFGQVS